VTELIIQSILKTYRHLVQTNKIKPESYEQEELILGYVLSGEAGIWNKIIKIQQFKHKTGSQILAFFAAEEACYKGTVAGEEHDHQRACNGLDVRKLVQPDQCVHIFRDLKQGAQNQAL
jgi:hypothetical protein